VAPIPAHRQVSGRPFCPYTETKSQPVFRKAYIQTLLLAPYMGNQINFGLRTLGFTVLQYGTQVLWFLRQIILPTNVLVYLSFFYYETVLK
jgi:hypothetical protein